VNLPFGQRFSRPLVQNAQVPSVHPSQGTPTMSPDRRSATPSPTAAILPTA
jgi:hypothetical protein